MILERFPGGPAMDVKVEADVDGRERCTKCGQPCHGDFTADGSDAVCRRCFWVIDPAHSLDLIAVLGMEMGGAGI